MTGLEEAVKGGNIFLIDSVTHFWQELMFTYMKQKGLTRLNINHIGNIKKEWKPFPDLYLNSPIHSILCGRAGFEWGYAEDDEGNKQLTKTGTKMKVEGDFGYEPTLLIEMEQIRADKDKAGSTFINRAWVIKDKFSSSGLQGQHFDMPTFDDFLPHISRLNINGKPPGIDMKTTSADIIESPDRSREYMYKQRDIFIEELKNELTLKFNSRTDDGKKEALKFLQETFNTTSMTAISSLDNVPIKTGLDKLKKWEPVKPKLETKKKK